MHTVMSFVCVRVDVPPPQDMVVLEEAVRNTTSNAKVLIISVRYHPRLHHLHIPPHQHFVCQRRLRYPLRMFDSLSEIANTVDQ